ncbi:PAS domain S-box protein [Roseivirga sp.]|uniref:hybrid sensor histidine kinase/response regulator n=1 Tax=Roseivirga sp. TaxID=1964215 RepID=UPI003B5164F8
MSHQSIQLLYIEDNDADAALLKIHVSRFDSDAEIDVTHVETLADGLNSLSVSNFDVVLLDLGLPGTEGLDGVKEILNVHPKCCMIVLSGNRSLELAKESIALGAQDFILKNDLNPGLLEKSIFFSLERLRLKKKLSAQSLKLTRLEIAVEQSANMIDITDLNGRIQYVNKRFEEVTGYSKEEIIGLKASTLKSDYHGPSFYQDLWATIRSGKTWKGTFKNKKKDGTLYWEDATISPVYNDKGELTNFVAIKEDITEAKAVKDRLNFTVEAARLGTWEWEVKADKILLNDIYAQLLGYTFDELDDTFSGNRKLIHPDDSELVQQCINEHLNGEKDSYEAFYRLRKKDGSYLWVYDSGIIVERDENHEAIKWSGVVVDVSKLKEQEIQLEFETKQLEATQAIGKIGSWYFDKSSRAFTYISPESLAIMGWSKDQVITRELILSMVHDDDRRILSQHMDQMIKGKSVSHVIRIWVKNELKWIKLKSSPKKSLKGKFIGVLALIQDVTEDQKARELVEASETKFKTIFENATVGIVYQDDEGKILDVNLMAAQILGVDHPELEQKTVDDDDWKFIDLDGNPLGPEDMPSNKVLKTKRPVHEDIVGIYNPTLKAYRWLKIDSLPIVSSQSGSLTTCTIFSDITEILEKEQKIRTNEAQLRAAQKIASFGHWTYDYRTDEYQWSDAAYEIFELKKGKVPSRELFMQMVHPDDRSRVLEIISEARRTFDKTHLEFKVKLASGEIKYLEDSWETNFGPDGKPTTVLGVYHDITNRKKAELRLYETKEKLASILESFDDIVVIIDNDLKVMEFFPGGDASDLLLPPEYLQGKRITRFLPNHVNKQLHQCISNLNQTNSTQEMEYGLVIDDQQRWFSAKLSSLHDSQQQVIGTTVVIRNVTLRKIALLEQERATQKLTSIITSLDDHVIVVDKEGYYREFFASRSGETTLSGAEQILGKKYQEVVSPELADLLAKSFSKVDKSGKTQTFIHKTEDKKGDSWYDTRVSPLYENKVITGYTLLIRDISLQKQNEIALAESEERFRYQSEFLPHIVWTTDAEGVVNYLNEVGRSFYGDGVEDLKKGSWNLIHPEDRHESVAKWEESLANKSSYTCLERHLCDDGKYYWLNVKANPLLDAQGNIVSWIGVSTNVNSEFEAKKLNDRLVKHLKQRVKEVNCLYRISHLSEQHLDSIPDILKESVRVVQKAFWKPGLTEVRITWDDHKEQTDRLKYANRLFQQIKYHGQTRGEIAVCVAKKTESGEPITISDQEYNLLNSVADNLGLILGQSEQVRLIEESEDRFRKLLEDATIGVIILTKSHFSGVNNRFLKMLGYTEEEVIGRNPWDISPKKQPNGQTSKAFGMELIERLEYEDQVNFTWHHLHKNGQLVICDIQLTTMDFRDGNAIVAFVRDMTEENKAQRALIESEQKYRAIFENINEGYVLVDIDGRIHNLNPSGAKILGINQSSALGTNLKEVLFGEELMSYFEKLNGHNLRKEISVKNSLGKKLRLNINAQKVKREGSSTLIEATFSDVSEQYRFTSFLNYSVQLYEAYNKGKSALIKVAMESFQAISDSKCSYYLTVNEDGKSLSLLETGVFKNVCQASNQNKGCSDNKLVQDIKHWKKCISSRGHVIRNYKNGQRFHCINKECALPIKQELQIPILQNTKVVALVGVSNKEHTYNDLDVELLGNYAHLFHSLLQRKELELEHLNTLETLAKSQEVGRIGSWKVDLKTNEAWWSDELYNHYELDPKKAQVPQEGWLEFTHPEDRNAHRRAYELGIKTGGMDHEYRIVLSDGRIRHLYAKSEVRYDADGVPQVEVGIVQDVTDLRLAHKMVEEKSKQFENIVSSLPGIVYRIKFPKMEIEFLSSFTEKVIGYTREDLVNYPGNFGELLVHPDDLESVIDEIGVSLRQRKSLSLLFRMKTKHNGVKWFSNTGTIVEKNKEKQEFTIEGYIHDVTDRVKSEERVRNAFMEASDKERSRISKEIHDSLQQTLTIASLNLEFIEQERDKLSHKVQERFDMAYDYLKRSLNDTRAIAHSLMPKAIEDFGFVSVVQAMVNDLNKAGDCHFEFITNMDQVRFKVPVDTNLYKIVQEATNNVLKHAQAQNVTIQYMRVGDKLQLSIEDDGTGFDISEIRAAQNGFGLANMRNRVSSLNADVLIDSYPGHGTTIIIDFPYTKDLLYI